MLPKSLVGGPKEINFDYQSQSIKGEESSSLTLQVATPIYDFYIGRLKPSTSCVSHKYAFHCVKKLALIRLSITLSIKGFVRGSPNTKKYKSTFEEILALH